MITQDPTFLIIDLFCGAGGFTEGAEQSGMVKVIIGINHDQKAIESHTSNHPETIHFVEDIRTIKMNPLVDILKAEKQKYPSALVLLHASLECTNFSKAKGGLPRDADSRTLADHLDRYVLALQPDYITIENVVEFMSWGPLDDNGKPISKKSGCDYMAWRQRIKSYGYEDQWKELNSANYGAFTSRNRLFGIFAKPEFPIVFPEPTHVKDPFKDKVIPHTGVNKWKAVREVLDLNDKGNSILTRVKPLSEKTLERILAGLVKFIAGGKKNYEEFIVKYNSTSKNGKVCAGHGMDEPCPTVATQGRLAIANVVFISKYFSGKPEHKNISIDNPAGTVKCVDNQAIVQTEFLSNYYSNGDNTHSLLKPSPTIRTKDGSALIQPQFIMRDFTNGGNLNDITTPAGAIMPNPKMNLTSAEFITTTNFNGSQRSLNEPCQTVTADRHHHYLLNPQFGNTGNSIDKPCFTIIARMDKRPPYLVETELGQIAIEFYETDSEMLKKIKQFMAMYGIVDIKMRMLRIHELLKIQGFPANYTLVGTQADQKKFIGNSVEVTTAKALVTTLATKAQQSLIAA